MALLIITNTEQITNVDRGKSLYILVGRLVNENDSAVLEVLL